MSMSYWGIIGYGLCVDDIQLNHNKVRHVIKNMCKDEDISENEDIDIFETDWFDGNPYYSVGEFLCSLDDERIMSFDDDGQGRSFFLYAPIYPWQIKDNDPKSTDDIEDQMVKIIQKVSDMSDEQIREKINYISDYGCG